tara:strand:+ start:77 stop:2878 length:2802 start_codon:yes stop_codon:yes gene_type:complete
VGQTSGSGNLNRVESHYKGFGYQPILLFSLHGPIGSGVADMKRKSIAVFVSALTLSLAANADVDEAKIALQSERYEDAIRFLGSPDNPSDPETAHLLVVGLLGIANKRSIQIEGDDFWLPGEKDRIEKLLNIGVAKGYAPAQLELAMFSSIGQDDFPNESWSLVVDAFNNGDAMAAAMLFGQYCEGKPQPVADQTLIASARELAYSVGDSDQEPNTYSAFMGALDDDAVIGGIGADYALALATGGCIPKDRQAALTLFDHLLARNQARSALASAIREAVERYEGSWLADTTPNGVGEDRVEAIFWLNYLAGHGLANSHDYASLAEYHLNEKYVPLDLSAAYTSLEKCYEYARPAEYLSCFGSTSFFIAKDIYNAPPDSNRHVSSATVLKTQLAAKAERILTLVAQRDSSPYFNFKQELADLYYWGETGSVTPLDYDAAFPLYEELADKGDESAQFRVAWMYSQGEGTPKNGNEAVRYYQMVASAGDKVAQFNLGVTLGNGEGVPKDEKSAVFWFRKAAEQGYSPAENMLGVMISEGQGTLENDSEAVNWFSKAANKGYAVAQYNLGLAFAQGEGVRVDLIEAYKWLNLAGAGGYSDAQSVKNSVSNLMTREQIAKAQALSAAWQPGAEEASNVAYSGRKPPSNAAEKASGQQRELTATVQSGLSELGYYRGGVDGLAGPQTKAAIEKFQTSIGSEPTGIVTPDLALSIGAAIGSGGTRVRRPSPTSNDVRATGSAFLVSGAGDLVTNAHVVSECEKLTLSDGTLLTLQAFEPASDLALLRSSSLAGKSALPLRSGKGIRLADSVMVAGFPLTGIVSPDLNVTTGNVSALSGPDGDRGLFQITAPVQSGNSGGPVLDQAGNLVGVVVSKLDAVLVANITGDLPQNVNFGISLGTLKSFLDANNVDYSSQQATNDLTNASIAEAARSATFQIQCY